MLSALACDLYSCGQLHRGRGRGLDLHLANLTSLCLLSPLPSCSSPLLSPALLGRAKGPPLPCGGPRHTHVFLVSRMSRRKRRPSTRSTHCRRPRRSARCPRPTCPLSSESAAPRHAPRACAGRRLVGSSAKYYLRAPAPCEEMSCEYSSEQDGVSVLAEVLFQCASLIINTQIIFSSDKLL